MTRPRSLFEVAALSATIDDFSMNVQDFLHEFQAHPGYEMLEISPILLASKFEKGDLADAYLAAVADSLSKQLRLARPGWSTEPERYLHSPWFASPGSSMRACLLLESPGPFRERNLFVTANALSVA